MELLKELDDVCQEKWVLTCLSKAKPATGKETKLTQLYRLVHAGDLTDVGMAKKIYGPDTPPTDPRYRTLKTRLKEVYLNAFMLREQEVPSYKTYDEALRNGYRLLLTARLLTERKAFLAARKIAESTYVSVGDYEIIPLNQGLTDMLASLYLGANYNEKLFQKYSELNEYYRQAYYDLSFVTNSYRKFRNSYYAQRFSPLEIGELADKCVRDCDPIRRKYPLVSHIQAMIISIDVIGSIQRGEHREAIKISSAGTTLLNQCKGGSQSANSILALLRIECCIKLNDFEYGLEQIKLSKPYVSNLPINNFALSEHAIRLGLRTENFYYSYKSILKVKLLDITKILPPTAVEEWQLYEAAINLLLKANKIPLPPNAPKLRRFRPGAFINKVPILSQNKAGTNIQILVYQFLFLLVQGKRGEMIDRAESLAAYARRHLKGPENIRNRSFFKLLGILVKANFNQLAAMKKAKSALLKLKESQKQINLNDTELVPYEALWEIALEHLDVRKADAPEIARLSTQ